MVVREMVNLAPIKELAKIYDTEQIKEIAQGFRDNLSIEEVENYTEVGTSFKVMSMIRKAYKILTKEQVKKLSEKKLDYSQFMKLREAFYNQEIKKVVPNIELNRFKYFQMELIYEQIEQGKYIGVMFKFIKPNHTTKILKAIFEDISNYKISWQSISEYLETYEELGELTALNKRDFLIEKVERIKYEYEQDYEDTCLD